MNIESDQITRKVVEFLVVYLFDLILFSLSMLLFEISFGHSLLYSSFNGIWMTNILMPLVEYLRFIRE
jgi:hypothetical protein